MRGALLVLSLAFCAGCGAASDCRDLCSTLVIDCEMGTWTDTSQCIRGCDDELFRHPAREEVIGCYVAASGTCDLGELLVCRQVGDDLAAGLLAGVD